MRAFGCQGLPSAAARVWIDLMAMAPTHQYAGNRTARQVFAGLPPRYNALAWVLSFGQDRRWRRSVVDAVAAVAPTRVLDVATGPAGVALAIARRCHVGVVGVDLNEPMLRQGLRNVRNAGLDGEVTLLVGQAERLPFAADTFDAVSFSYLLRYVDDPEATIHELARCLRPGGVLASLEFYVPPQRVWRAAWRLYTTAVLPVVGGLAGGRPWWRVGRFLGPSIRDHYERMPLADHVTAWQRAGLGDIEWRVMSLGGGLVMSGRKRTA
jgi:demethylmenaquinone methyltransferase/2-methoxy-6-polyprenyl-1,4-benzoquinol methylase